MKISAWISIVASILLALVIGWWLGHSARPMTAGPLVAAADGSKPMRQPLYYRNPMGLPDTSPVPKRDAMGMDYVAVFADGEAPVVPGTVVISPEKVQKLGVRTVLVQLQEVSPNLRASATVQVDETRQYVIAPRFEGWVERLYADQTGMAIGRGQPLLSIYSPQLVAAQNEYRIADNAATQLEASDPASAASMRRLRDSARTRLRNWDISAAQLAHLSHAENAGNLVLSAPADVVVVEKLIAQGSRFDSGETILRLADLSMVWLVADVPASNAGGVRIGQLASFQSPTLPGQTFDGRVSFVQPIINPMTRTLAVRIALDNPTGVLRPGLFGDVTLTEPPSAPVLTVPRSAVLDSGTRQTVLVQLVEGRFEPRPVTVGERSGDLVEIRQGLSAGERVVVSANFLIDAESQLQSALDGLSPHQGHGASSGTPSAATDTAPTASAATPVAPEPADDRSRDAHSKEH